MGRKEVWVQGGAHSKRVVRKKPIPENRRVKSRGHAPVPAGRTKKTHPNTYVSISAIRPYATKKLGGVQWYVFRRRKIMTDERKTKRPADPRRSKGRRRKYYGRSTARPAGNVKIRGRVAGRKTLFSSTLGLPRLGKDTSGGGGLKSRK